MGGTEPEVGLVVRGACMALDSPPHFPRCFLLTRNGFAQVELDLSYKERFYTGASAVYSPDAYTRLLLDVLTGKQSAFVRDDELLASWALWGPLLKQIEAEGAPVPIYSYEYGSRGPEQAAALIEKYGYQRNAGYAWKSGGNL